MRAQAIDAAVAAANPVPRDALASPRIERAGALLLAAIACEPRAARTPALPPSPARARATVRRPRLLAAGAAAAIAAAVIGLALSGGGGPGAGSPAFGAQLIRYAENSPLVLLQLDGWHVNYAAEDSAQEGELHFLPDGAGESDVSHEAELHWREGPLSGWIADRAASSDLRTAAPALGTSARVFRYSGGSPRASAFTALWLYRGRVLEFRATTADLAAFTRMLSALRAVDATAWLSALPASVVRAAEHPATVSAMLNGIPLPPGFDASRVGGSGQWQNRYQLGAAVAGTVACTWIERWLQARGAGNQSEAREAVAAMSTAPKWPVLHEMESQGAYPQVLEGFAAAMATGSWHGYPLAAAASEGLGCRAFGVHLPLAANERSYGPQPAPAPSPSGGAPRSR